MLFTSLFIVFDLIDLAFNSIQIPKLLSSAQPLGPDPSKRERISWIYLQNETGRCQFRKCNRAQYWYLILIGKTCRISFNFLDYGINVIETSKIPRGPRFIQEPESIVFDVSGML